MIATRISSSQQRSTELAGAGGGPKRLATWAPVRGADPLAATLSRVSRRHGGDGGRLQHQVGPAPGESRHG
jgi:hypothetical protein